MKVSRTAIFLALIFAFPAFLCAQTNFPRMTSIEPMTAKVGDIVSVSGEHLDKANVADVLLTDNRNDYKVEITEQSEASIKFKVPDNVKPGKFSLVIRTPASADNPPKEYVQPVKVTIQE